METARPDSPWASWQCCQVLFDSCWKPDFLTHTFANCLQFEVAALGGSRREAGWPLLRSGPSSLAPRAQTVASAQPKGRKSVHEAKADPHTALTAKAAAPKHTRTPRVMDALAKSHVVLPAPVLVSLNFLTGTNT